MTQQFVGQQFPVQSGSVWADMVTYLTEVVGERDDWYVGVDIHGKNFLSAEGLDQVWYLEDVFPEKKMSNIEISQSDMFEKIIIGGGEKTLKRLQDTFPTLKVFPWRTFKIGVNAGGIASIAIAMDAETFNRFQRAVAEAKQKKVWVSFPVNDGLLWDGVDNHIWGWDYDNLSDVINILKVAVI